MKNELAVYLRLTPEFGGTRFGPFEGVEVVLGSDKERCDITLPESLGVLPCHVKVLRQPDMSMLVAPTERTSTVFLWKQRARKPTQLQTATAVRAGDSFALVTEDGPRFIVELDKLPEEILEKRRKKRGVTSKRLSLGAMKNESKRQVFTRLLVTGPGQIIQRAWTFVKSGAIFQPRYIFLGIALVGGYIWGGSMSCTSRKHKKNWTTTTTRLESCKGNLAFAENMGASENNTIPQLMARIVDSHLVGRALEEDDKLREAVLDAARAILTQASTFQWLLDGGDGRAGTFAEWREALVEEERLDPDFILVAPYIAAESDLRRSEWSRREDSLQADVCTRGMVRMTFRQGLHLGLTVQPDALVTGNLEAFSRDKEAREQALLASIHGAGLPGFPDTFESDLAPFPRNRSGCVYLQGQDDRLERGRLVAALARQLGEDSPLLPPPESPHSVPARLAKFYAADIPGMDFTERQAEVDFSQFPVGTTLRGLGSKGSWVLDRTAETIAKSVVLPCEAVLREGTDEKMAEKVFGRLPDVVPCLVLNYRLRSL